jgi:protein-tyrosine phosphatase
MCPDLGMEAKVYWVDNGPGRIGIMPRPRGGDWLEDEIRSLRNAGVDVLVSLLTGEEAQELDLTQEAALCARSGIEFLSFPVLDRDVPARDSNTEAFLARLAAKLVAKKSVVIHCRAGIGRSALLAASLLVRGGVAVDEAFKRIAAARGCAVPDTPKQYAWVDYYAAMKSGDRSRQGKRIPKRFKRVVRRP